MRPVEQGKKAGRKEEEGIEAGRARSSAGTRVVC
jgi:hypothetical protein